MKVVGFLFLFATVVNDSLLWLLLYTLKNSFDVPFVTYKGTLERIVHDVFSSREERVFPIPGQEAVFAQSEAALHVCMLAIFAFHMHLAGKQPI